MERVSWCGWGQTASDGEASRIGTYLSRPSEGGGACWLKEGGGGEGGGLGESSFHDQNGQCKQDGSRGRIDRRKHKFDVKDETRTSKREGETSLVKRAKNPQQPQPQGCCLELAGSHHWTIA